MRIPPIDLLAELKQLVKYAGAYEGAVVIEARERNRADKLQRELDRRAVVDQELERLRGIEEEWKRLESQLPTLLKAKADAAAWEGPAILWKQYQQWAEIVRSKYPLLAALYERQLLGGTGAYPMLVHEWAMLLSYSGKRTYSMLEKGFDLPKRSTVKQDCARDRASLGLDTLFNEDPSPESITRFVQQTLMPMAADIGVHLVPDTKTGVTREKCVQFTLSCDAVKAAEVVEFNSITGVVTGLTYPHTLSDAQRELFKRDRAAFAEWVQARKHAKEVASDIHIFCLSCENEGLSTLAVGRIVAHHGKATEGVVKTFWMIKDTLRALGLLIGTTASDGDSTYLQFLERMLEHLRDRGKWDPSAPLHAQAEIRKLVELWLHVMDGHHGTKIGRYQISKPGVITSFPFMTPDGKWPRFCFMREDLLRIGFRPQWLSDDAGSKLDDTLTLKVFAFARLGEVWDRLERVAGEKNVELPRIEEYLAERGIAPDAADPDWAIEVAEVLQRYHCNESLVGQETAVAIGRDAIETPLDELMERDADKERCQQEAMVIRRAYWHREWDRLVGIYLGLLPFVLQEQIMTCQALSQAHRQICCEFLFAYIDLYWRCLEACDLHGGGNLPRQVRLARDPDVLLMGTTMLKKELTWAYAISELMAQPRGNVKLGALGTMTQERYHGDVRYECQKNDSAVNIQLNMGRAAHLAFLRSKLGMQPQLGASRVRARGGDVHVTGCDDSEVLPLGSVMQCVIVSLTRLGVWFPRSVVRDLHARGMMPDIANWQGPAHLHELILIPPDSLARVRVSTANERITLTRGYNKFRLYKTGKQLRAAGTGEL
jgi:hypothetical protein